MPITPVSQTRRPAAPARPAARAAAVAPTRGPAIARDAMATGGVEQTGALRSPQAYQGKVIALIGTAQAAQRALATAQKASPVDAKAVSAAVQELEAAQAELGVLKLLGARCASGWAKEGFDQGAFWKAQLAAAPDLVVVDGEKGGFLPKFGDKAPYKNFAVRLVGQARAAAADLAALQASGKASPAELESARIAVRAAEAELVLMKKEADRNSFPWRLKGFDVKGFWKEQAKALPQGFDLDKTQLVDQVRVGDLALKPDVVVKLWPGEDPHRVIAGNNADNLAFRMDGSKEVYVATAVDLGMGKEAAIAPGDRVTFRGQAGTVLAVTSPVNSKIRATSQSKKAGVDSVNRSMNAKNFLPFVGLMTLSVTLLASQGGSIITGLGLKIGIGFAVVFFGGLIALCAGAAMSRAFRWLEDISLYQTQAHGDPQYFAPPVAR